MRAIAWMVIGGVLSGTAALAQTPAVPAAEPAPSPYQIGQMERLLEGAVEHGASVWRAQMQRVIPSDMLIAENARARGFELQGYGVFFDVEVPGQTMLPWSFQRTLDQNNLGLEAALTELRKHFEKVGDVNLQQAFKRMELQVAPISAVSATTTGGINAADARNEAERAGGLRSPAPAAETAAPTDQFLTNPLEAFRSEIKKSLMEAMLDYSGALAIDADEWLTIAARRSDDRARLAVADNDVHTTILRVKGSDLAAYRSRQISKEDAIKRIEVRMF